MPIALIEEFIKDCNDSIRHLVQMRNGIIEIYNNHKFDENQSIAIGFEDILDGLHREFKSYNLEKSNLLKELSQYGNENSKAMAS